MAANIAGLRLTLDNGGGKIIDLADKVNPRLAELTLTEKLGGEADQLQLTLHNADGRLEPPEPGKLLTLAIGWTSGDDVQPGLVEKGLFMVDEVEQSGPPDIVTIRARSADFTGRYKQRRTTAWKDTTLGAVLGEIAARHGLAPRVHADLASRPVKALEQHGRSDMAFVRDLGRRYDAVATVKNKSLIFVPIGSKSAASGQPLPAITLTRKQGWSWRFTRAARDEHDGAEAEWHDAEAGRRRKVTSGGAKNPKRLKRVYASEADARAAADGAAAKGKRGGFSFEYDLAFADCALQPGQPVTLKGWNRAIHDRAWLIASVETALRGGGGLTQKISLEGA